MRLLARYVARQFLTTFVVLVLGLPLLFVITDVTDNLDRYLGRGLEFGSVALAYLYQIPQFLQWAFPIAALVATVFTIGNMTRHQEIAAAKAGGISFYRLILPLVLLGVVLSGRGSGTRRAGADHQPHADRAADRGERHRKHLSQRFRLSNAARRGSLGALPGLGAAGNDGNRHRA